MVEPGCRCLGDRYELQQLIAAGGMGQVWRAVDTALLRPVAVKVLRSEYTGDATFVARFRAEAQHAALLTHRNIAALYDYGETSAADGELLAYLVMELVEGESLAQLLAREGRLSADRTLEILRQAASGLAAAHAAGLVHRDVKPGNVLVGSDGSVKLTDFGIACSAASAPLTQTGQVLGTAHYISPEQAAGSRAGPASDVYALGMIGFECLAGHRAFDGENPVQIAMRQLHEPPPPLPADVPEQVRTLIDRALLKEPAERFADGAAFREAVDDVLAGRPLAPVAARADTRPLAVVPARPPVRRRILAPLAPLLVGAGLGIAALQVWADAPVEFSTGTMEAPASILLSAADYAGRPVAEVEAELALAGLGVELVREESSAVPAGHVLRVTPVGAVVRGSVVTVAYAVAPPVPVPVPVPEPEPVPLPVSVPEPVPVPVPEPVPLPVPVPVPEPKPVPLPVSASVSVPVPEPEPVPLPLPEPAPAPAPMAPVTVSGGAPAPVPAEYDERDVTPGNGNGNGRKDPGKGNGKGAVNGNGNGKGAANGNGNGKGAANGNGNGRGRSRT